jgi:hypothetical protein
MRQGIAPNRRPELRFAVTIAFAVPSSLSVRKGVAMSLQSRIEALRERHASLEMRIADEDQRPRPDSDVLWALKVEKLRLKEELERLQSQVH